MQKDFDKWNEMKRQLEYGTAILADGGSSIVPRMMLQRVELVSPSIADGVWVSSEKDAPVDNGPLKPDRGIEPLGHEVTSSTLHHASGYGGFYHTLLSALLLSVGKDTMLK